MAADTFRETTAADAFCRSASSPRSSQKGGREKVTNPPQHLPGFENGRIDQVALGEIIGWRWWKVIDGGLFTLNGSRPVLTGPFEADFPERGGVAAFKHRHAAERMFAALSANWAARPEAVTFQSELPAGAPRVAPDAYCLGSVELWGAVHEYERGYLGQFVCVSSADRITGPMSEPEAAAILASLHKRYICRSQW
jgi:hypothetical protein